MITYIEHYDQGLDLTFELPEFDISGSESFDLFLAANPGPVQFAIFSAISTALELGLERVPVFAVRGSDAIIGLDRNQFNEKLDACLGYFISIEEYEACSEVAELKSLIS